MSVADLTSEQRLQHALVVAAGQGLLKGLLHRGRAIGEAEAVVAQTLERRVEVARQLVAMDRADHPAEGREQRLANFGRLMEAVVYAGVARGQSALDALNQANRQRDRLFASAKGPREDANAAVVDLTLILQAAVLQGRLMAGVPFESANSEARHTEDTCLSIARRLFEINRSGYPDAHDEMRLRGVGQLMAATVVGLLQRQERVATAKTALMAAYDKNAVAFASVQRTIDRQVVEAGTGPTTGGTDAGPAPAAATSVEPVGRDRIAALRDRTVDAPASGPDTSHLRLR